MKQHRNMVLTLCICASLSPAIQACFAGAVAGNPPPPADAPFDEEKAKQHQQVWGKHLNTDVELTNSIGTKMMLIPPGEFQMGSPESDKDAYDNQMPSHRVRLAKAFYLGKFEVTQKEWKTLMGSEPWKNKNQVRDGQDYPATYVRWDDAITFCRKLSLKEGRIYRLPTEAEWEYACRAGTTTHFHFGDDESDLSNHGWYEKNATKVKQRYAHRVGLKPANPFGLHDMHGNVWEWCRDWYDAHYYAKSPIIDPQGPDKGSERVCRSGSYGAEAMDCWSAYRAGLLLRGSDLGFRLACTPSGQ